MLVNYLVPQNLGKVLARENDIRTANQGGEKAVKLFQIYRALVPKALEISSRRSNSASLRGCGFKIPSLGVSGAPFHPSPSLVTSTVARALCAKVCPPEITNKSLIHRLRHIALRLSCLSRSKYLRWTVWVKAVQEVCITRGVQIQIYCYNWSPIPEAN